MPLPTAFTSPVPSLLSYRLTNSGDLLGRRLSPSAPHRRPRVRPAMTSPLATPPHSSDPAPPNTTVAVAAVPIRRALLSVSDKSGLEPLVRALAAHGVELISTGGTARAIADLDLPVRQVSDVTSSPEMLGGRVKTLHPAIHAGLLAVRDDAQHMSDLQQAGVAPIDLVVVNLYPFEQSVAAARPFADCVENIDVGGPTMIRAAAKNFAYVTVVTDVAQYDDFVTELQANSGATSLAMRTKLAAAAFARLAAYDAAVAAAFATEIGASFPPHFTLAGTVKQRLRYGENPHQQAAFYATAGNAPGLARATQVQGKELSFNNIADTDAAFMLVAEFAAEEFGPVCAIIKHANPCGVAVGSSPRDAYVRALSCDPVSAFGGIVAFNVPVDEGTAVEIAKLFVEVIIAPVVEPAAAEVLATKKNLRVLVTGALPDAKAPGISFKSVSGGFLVQTADHGSRSEADVSVVTKRLPSKDEMRNLLFAWKVCKHVKSNAIVYASDLKSVGAGAGQMSRVDSSRIAAWKAEEAAKNAGEVHSRAKGSVVASDAFFPFADGLLAAADAGATAVIQPGGSKRDAEVIAAADERGLAMVFTGMRHFRH